MSALALLRQLLAGFIGAIGATAPQLPTWGRAALIAIGLAIAAVDHIDLAIAKKKACARRLATSDEIPVASR